MTDTTTANASPRTAKTEWVAGRHPHESLRLTLSKGRFFVGAKGWDRDGQRNAIVQVELDQAGLHLLAQLAHLALADQAAPDPEATVPLQAEVAATEA